MFLLTNVYYFASDGCPDAVPAGMVAFKLGMNNASHHDEEIDEIWACADSLGLTEDLAGQLGFDGDDLDLIFRTPPGEDEPTYLLGNQICSDWQWELIKQHPGLVYCEHDLDKIFDEFIEAHEQEG